MEIPVPGNLELAFSKPPFSPSPLSLGAAIIVPVDPRWCGSPQSAPWTPGLAEQLLRGTDCPVRCFEKEKHDSGQAQFCVVQMGKSGGQQYLPSLTNMEEETEEQEGRSAPGQQSLKIHPGWDKGPASLLISPLAPNHPLSSPAFWIQCL